MTLLISGTAWGGSIPWGIYLAARGEIPWSTVIICTPIYLLLLYGLKPVWIRARQKDSEYKFENPEDLNKL
jgi:hypothetical protein